MIADWLIAMYHDELWINGRLVLDNQKSMQYFRVSIFFKKQAATAKNKIFECLLKTGIRRRA